MGRQHACILWAVCGVGLKSSEASSSLESVFFSLAQAKTTFTRPVAPATPAAGGFDHNVYIPPQTSQAFKHLGLTDATELPA